MSSSKTLPYSAKKLRNTLLLNSVPLSHLTVRILLSCSHLHNKTNSLKYNNVSSLDFIKKLKKVIKIISNTQYISLIVQTNWCY